jgi:hypothetical protein
VKVKLVSRRQTGPFGPELSESVGSARAEVDDRRDFVARPATVVHVDGPRPTLRPNARHRAVVPVSGGRDDGGDDGIGGYIRRAIRSAGRQYEQSREQFTTGRTVNRLPADEHGRAKIVCRRHADRRAVMLSGEGVPPCFDAENRDCQGCLEDIREGVIETW